MSEKKKRELAELVQGALEAQAAGVVLRLKDWNRFSRKEKGAWLAARKLLRRGPAPARAPEASPHAELDAAIAAREAEPEVDQELRATLEHGADLVEQLRERA